MDEPESRPPEKIFPARRVQDATRTADTGHMEAAQADGPSVDGRAPLILVADDDDDIRSLVELRLRKAGYEVVAAADGGEALRLTKEHDPDLLVLDVSMPVLDGYAVCREVQALGPNAPPVIFLTARTHAAGVLEGFEVGASDYVTKPFRPAELLVRVQATLRTKALRDAYAYDATTDALTGLLNRRGLATRAAEALSIARRHERPLACLIVDLDHFKAVNDTFGHAAGDRALRATGHLIRDNVRASDVVARYGGEEFLLLLPEADEEGAHAVADKLRRVIAESPVEIENADGSSTTVLLEVSVGVASWDPTMTEAEDLYAAADRALYEAKGRGRNRVVLASWVA
jgi:diguanylate cyclase (GGDEF)-like protein